MFDTLTDSFKNAIGKIRFHDDDKALKKATAELKKSLLTADVHHKVVKELIAAVEHDTKLNGIGKDQFLHALQKELTRILTLEGAPKGFTFASKPPTVVLMIGLQGSGKTTTTGKLAYFLKEQKKKKVMVIAADLQRLAAVEQLRQITASIGVELVADESATPTQIVKQGLLRAEKELYDVVLIDTAGRLAIDDELMDELASIKQIANPDELFYVADAMTGQDAVRTAQTFKEKIGITGVVLSKFDGDSKGGVALGLTQQVGVPLRFIGAGEKMPDLEQFISDRIVSRLMGAGDVEGLAEKAAAAIDPKEAKKFAQKIKKGQFNFNDFLAQMEQMKKLGSMKSIMGMIPGMGAMAKQIGEMDLENSTEMKQIKALVSSMTPKERENPDLLNNMRKRRLAAGAGLDPTHVNRVLKQFKNAAMMAKKMSTKGGMKQMQDMMAQMKGGGIPR
ncbi:MAG TPA: signal recognition particle protein [Sulfurovum sp.]|jgi:signal recognition particle subunit SRP54|nr:MAG: signal recognition particle protein [Sulfurovum sp. 35-42-20]OYZ25834.1 MAG: signal recognition particle protein [Sulfurovum sp. 16-42-52]OYZ49446.1 MAG: signal recognition particle protein [Sulfurovum sp. 24-42-9]OZA45214.1 MAG: signal recognition particle protein [Sulfurovum sp. 17-42-90]OZA59923.1 MAG: signal recognition particle protein [Sulfurovum sp. 39-42-12]HQR73635.1 signal recognition particle protein [Sulfurovum sp.]